jgi:hypothetical protein
MSEAKKCCPQCKCDQTPRFDSRLVTARKTRIIRPNKRTKKRKFL